MFELRPYQREALDELYAYFEQETGNPLIVLPTGTGKSLFIAKLCEEAITQYPQTRIVIAAHVKELISQNFQELIKLWPQAPAGVNSASLGKRDYGSRILFVGIQSVYNRAYDIGQCDLLLVDEAQLIPRKSGAMYRKFISDLKAQNPHMKVIGLTATPYRMDSGMLHEGDDAIFDAIAYEYSVLDAIQQGYLSPVVPKAMKTELDVSGVKTSDGDFIQKQLQAAIDIDDTNRAVVDEVVLHGQDRKSWLIFGSGIAHCTHLRDLVREAGYTCETISDETPGWQRDMIIRKFKAGEIRALASMDILTTGFNAPGVDLIAMVRPTKSAGLYVQIVGRGTRLFPGKTDCKVLDFAGNTARHGPIDKVTGRRKKRKKGEDEEPAEAPTKTCPECDTIVFASVRECITCGYEFPPPRPEIAPEAATDAILSTQIVPVWIDIVTAAYTRHEKPGSPPSMKVTYGAPLAGLEGEIGATYSEWICFEHSGYARQKAYAWWRKRSPGTLMPNTVEEALSRTSELPITTGIQISKAGRYTEIINHRLET